MTNSITKSIYYNKVARISSQYLKFLLFTAIHLCSFSFCFGNSERYLELADSADFYIARENWDKAEAKIIEALRLEPANFTNSLLLSNLGTVQTAKGEYEKALQSYELALSIAPSSAISYNNRARTLILMDRLSEALNDLTQSLTIDPEQEWPLQTKGFLLLGENKNDSARIVFESLRNLFPENFLAHTGLATIAQREGDDKIALDEYDKALKLNPEDIETNASKIMLLIELEKFSEARTLINKNLSYHPNEAIFYLLRGYLHKLNFRPDEADADRKIAIDKGLDPAYVETFIPSRKK